MKKVFIIALVTCFQALCSYGYTINTFEASSSGVCDVDDNDRFDCFPGPNANEQACITRGCCWKPATNEYGAPLNVPYCYYGVGNFGYRVTNVEQTSTGLSLQLALNGPGSPYGGNINNLVANVAMETDNRIRVTIRDSSKKRYEVPLPTPDVTTKASNPNYRFTYTKYPFGFAVTRISNGKTIFNSSIGGFVYSDQFLQMSSLLPSSNIYGLGEHVLGLKLSTNWNQLTMFSRDVADPPGGVNLYGVQPFYLNMEDDGQANGVFLLNSNALDIILQPKPAITYRSIGGILDFYILLGPSPNEVVQQFTDIVGRSTMPPYWALGFHLCRYGYNTIENMQMVRKRMEANQIPQDTQWNDIDYMDGHKDFTIDGNTFHGLSQFVDDLHTKGMHYVLMLDPAISNTEGYGPYESGVANNVFIKDNDGDILVGKVWPGTTVFPDFTNPNTTSYWYTNIKNFHDQIKFDGLWIDMNEPSNFVQGSLKGCPDSSNYEHPPYQPAILGGLMYDKTICMTAQQHLGKHYDLHSLYGHTEAVATMAAIRKVLGKRSLVITRSSYSGTGPHAGHWLGDNFSTWEYLYKSIPGLLNFNIFGISMVGADICGFLGNTNEELCSRWMQLGAFYPFMRNHNDIASRDQDPASFGDQLIKASKGALNVRYTLLPYLYTLFFVSYVDGFPVARPLFFEFPKDANTYAIDTQFLWGEAVLFSPVLKQGASSVNAYIPPGIWYEYYTGTKIASKGEYINLPASFEKLNIHMRGGYIIPTQDAAMTTTQSRQNSFGVLVYLDENETASGNLFLDDGESFLDTTYNNTTYMTFSYAKGVFHSSSMSLHYVPEHHLFDHMTVYGISSEPSKCTANGNNVLYQYSGANQSIYIYNMPLSITEDNEVACN